MMAIGGFKKQNCKVALFKRVTTLLKKIHEDINSLMSLFHDFSNWIPLEPRIS